VGCGDKAKDLYDTAQLEEKQFNKRTRRNFIGRSSKNIPTPLRESGEGSFSRVGESALDTHQENRSSSGALYATARQCQKWT
jgi:hypothetical protein